MEIKDLIKMLTFMRPAGSWAEVEYIKQYIEPTGAKPDKVGNYHLKIGDKPSILFSSHTDTVHKKSGYQKIYYDKKLDTLEVKRSDCLGADDTTGNWLMLAMIYANIPGYYIFHYGEEIGGIGSSYIADKTPEKLDGIDHAIAFDRMGTKDVIITQGQDCASIEFAAELCDALDMTGNKWKPADGVFTDTANYTHLVSECTNISVGYDDQHTHKETQLVRFAAKLRDKLLMVDWDSLNAYRKPVDPWADYDNWGYGSLSGYGKGYGSGYSGYGGSATGYRDDLGISDGDYRDGWSDFDKQPRAASSQWADMLDVVESNPEDIAAMLIDYGYDAQDVWSYIEGWKTGS